VSSGSAWQELRGQFLAELQRAAPKYFLVVRNDAIPWVTGTPEDSAHAFGHFDALRQWIERAYHIESTIEDFVIYRRN
jgi:hypothetical protein